MKVYIRLGGHAPRSRQEGREVGRAVLFLLIALLTVTFLILVQFAGGPSAGQPIAFNHRAHAEKEIDCVFCHQYAGSQAVAGMPSVQLCATCHSGLGTQTDEIKKIFTYWEKRREIPWVRVYGFPPQAQVIFTHARHVAANISCAVCHGDVAQMTVAVRAVEHTMGWCVNCHKQNQAMFAHPDLATDCLTCHK